MRVAVARVEGEEFEVRQGEVASGRYLFTHPSQTGTQFSHHALALPGPWYE